MTAPTEIVTEQWFVLDDRGYRRPHLCEEDARHETGKPGNEGWSVVSQKVTFGPLVDHGGMW